MEYGLIDKVVEKAGASNGLDRSKMELWTEENTVMVSATLLLLLRKKSAGGQKADRGPDGLHLR